MSEPIKPGDLVYIANPSRCGCAPRIGQIGRVVRIWRSLLGTRCEACNTSFPGPVMYVDNEDGWFASLHRVKRIPEFPELKDERHDEEITA